MKVLDLHCSHQHSFEGWFASENDFLSQLTRALVACPLCGDTAVTKKLSAPRLNLNTARGERESHAGATASAASASQPTISEATASPLPVAADTLASLDPAQLQAAWLMMVRHVMANTEDVGHSFSEQARKMHYGETESRNIRGHATPEETEALLDEGIQVMPLPMPEALKGPIQ